MLQKNIDKEKRKERKTWQPFYSRKTKTKKEALLSEERKHKKRSEDE